MEILRSRGNVDVRLTKSGNVRSKQVFVTPTEKPTNEEWVPGEYLSRLKCSKAWLFFFGYDLLRGDAVYLQ